MEDIYCTYVDPEYKNTIFTVGGHFVMKKHGVPPNIYFAVEVWVIDPDTLCIHEETHDRGSLVVARFSRGPVGANPTPENFAETPEGGVSMEQLEINYKLNAEPEADELEYLVKSMTKSLLHRGYHKSEILELLQGTVSYAHTMAVLEVKHKLQRG